MKRSVINIDPDIQSGTPVFTGTRVPLKNLFDYLQAGDTLNEFLDQSPSVTRSAAIDALELARMAADQNARSSR